MEKNKDTYYISDEKDYDEIVAIGRAFSVPDRLKILHLLNAKSLNVNEIAKLIKRPLSSTAFHVSALEEAGLIHTIITAGTKGNIKLCSRKKKKLSIEIDEQHFFDSQLYECEMPLGAFTECSAQISTCGLASETGIIGKEDRTNSFYLPQRIDAQLIWFNCGYIKFCFPYEIPSDNIISEISFSLELCSEAPNYRNDWPSDITLSINNIETCVYRSRGDFGGRHGKLTPAWWSDGNTQFGLLKTFAVKNDGVYIDETIVNHNIRINDLALNSSNLITFELRVKSDAEFCGGINIFGKKFGDYPQDIIMKVFSKPKVE